MDNMVRLWLQGRVRGKDQKVRLLRAQVLFSTRLWLVTVDTLTGHLSGATSAQRVLRLITPFREMLHPKEFSELWQGGAGPMPTTGTGFTCSLLPWVSQQGHTGKSQALEACALQADQGERTWLAQSRSLCRGVLVSSGSCQGHSGWSAVLAEGWTVRQYWGGRREC